MMLWPQLSFSQDITLLQQFNGRYDFTFIGNTLNTIENGSIFADCTITTSSSAVLSLAPNDVIEKAYLYWAGSGPGDFTVKLNGLDVVPERTFNLTQSTSGFIFFSAFTDITAMVQATGNGVYLFSDLDVSAIIPDYCTNRTNFAGWAIVIVYQNNALPLNQLNVYDGLEYVAQDHEELVITLDNLNVIDNDNAQIGFVAWEGDSGIANNESLSVNGNLMSNALNPSNNAFNGTNSITGSSALYNMDLDIYNVQNNIDIGDTSAEIKLTSSQDFVMINCIVTKFNSQLPDATIVGGNVTRQCDLRTILCDYTIYNVNATDPLPAGTPFAIYAGTTLVGTGLTQAELPVGGSEAGQMAVVIPPEIPIDFDLVFVVDDDGTGTGFVTELSENNNTYVTQVSLLVSPAFNVPTDLISCNQGLGSGTFDFSAYEDLVRTNTDDTVSYYESQDRCRKRREPDPQRVELFYAGHAKTDICQDRQRQLFQHDLVFSEGAELSSDGIQLCFGEYRRNQRHVLYRRASRYLFEVRPRDLQPLGRADLGRQQQQTGLGRSCDQRHAGRRQ
jgi:hypothetical protein